MATSVARIADQATYFSDSDDYTLAFERRGARKSVEGTRAYDPAERAEIYATALYSTLIEPLVLSEASLGLLGREVEEVTFSSESGDEQFATSDIKLTEIDLAEMSTLREALEQLVKRAS
jgi:hypothetical protein